MATTTTRARVLIVEDEEAARNALAKLLKSEGLDVEVAEDGEVALLKTEERAPDLIVTDVSMPKMDGLELLAKVREKHKDLPVIVVTSAHDLSIAVRAMRAGAEGFITKTIDFDALIVAIEHAAGLRHREARRREPRDRAHHRRERHR